MECFDAIFIFVTCVRAQGQLGSCVYKTFKGHQVINVYLIQAAQPCLEGFFSFSEFVIEKCMLYYTALHASNRQDHTHFSFKKLTSSKSLFCFYVFGSSFFFFWLSLENTFPIQEYVEQLAYQKQLHY